jgi:hypothetical protein
MGKRKKEHRKKVAKRNERLKILENSFMKRFKEQFLKEVESSKKVDSNTNNTELEGDIS